METLTGRNDLLNIVCDICAMVNYIHIISVTSSKDPLTNLYDRRAYYDDVARYKNSIVTEMMNASDGFISRLNKTEEISSEFQDTV